MSKACLVPPGWQRVSLADVATEHCVRVDNPAACASGRFVGSENIGAFDLKVRRWGSSSEVTSGMKAFRRGDYLLVRRSLYASDFRERAALADFDGVCSGDILTIRERGNEVCPGFLSCILYSPRLWEFIVSHATGTITRRIKWRQLESFEFALPPTDHQQRVVKLISSIDLVAVALNNALQLARALRASLIRTDIGMTEPGRGGRESAPLSSLCEVVRGASPRPAGDPRYFHGTHTPWITVGEVTKDDSMYLTSTSSCLTALGSRHSRKLERGTVVLTNSGYTLGVPKILGIDGCANDGVAAFLSLAPSLDPQYLYYGLLGMTKLLRSSVAAGGDQPNLNTTRIGALEVPVVSLVEQRRVVERLGAVDQLIEALKERYVGASTTLRRLLSQGLTEQLS
jgi:type I restriction enzyme S subunit